MALQEFRCCCWHIFTFIVEMEWGHYKKNGQPYTREKEEGERKKRRKNAIEYDFKLSDRSHHQSEHCIIIW